GLRGRVAMVRRGCAHRLEELAALAVRLEVAGPGAGVAAGDFAEPVEVLVEAGEIRVDDVVGTVGGDDPALPAGLADHLVPPEIVDGAVGGRDDLEVEALVERARPEVVAV